MVNGGKQGNRAAIIQPEMHPLFLFYTKIIFYLQRFNSIPARMCMMRSPHARVSRGATRRPLTLAKAGLGSLCRPKPSATVAWMTQIQCVMHPSAALLTAFKLNTTLHGQDLKKRATDLVWLVLFHEQGRTSAETRSQKK